MLRNPQNDRVYAPAVSRKTGLQYIRAPAADTYYIHQINDRVCGCVHDGVNGPDSCRSWSEDQWCIQKLLPAVRKICGDFQQHNAPAHRARETTSLLNERHLRSFHQTFAPEKPDLNPLTTQLREKCSSAGGLNESS